MTTPASAGARRRGRWAVWLLAVVLLTPVAELLVILRVADLIGSAPVVLWLVLDVVVGAMILRRGGASTFRRVREVARSGRPPTREVADAALTVLGGVLFIVPGFVTDLLAVLCLVPPFRTGARALLGFLLGRAVARTAHRVRTARGQVVAGAVIEDVVDEVVEGRVIERGGDPRPDDRPDDRPDADRPRPGG